MECLRTEIIEAQKAYYDLTRWKLLVVAALGAASMGLGADQPVSGIRYLIALIPLACNYVDLLCYTVRLRILVIHYWLVHAQNSHDSNWQVDYEKFAARARNLSIKGAVTPRARLSAFGFEDLANLGATVVSCLLILLIEGWSFIEQSRFSTETAQLCNSLSALAGLLLALSFWRGYRQRTGALASLSTAYRDERQRAPTDPQ
ncbi:MAG TPA: hypothetical protein VF017_08785 [Thermoanaerobaculia bacterium]|nr:hypothetical protein [Thermoanaerobaculia bacterium]